MGRSPCCDKVGLKKGTWTTEEDQKLLSYIERYGHGNWRALPAKAGLQRCGKSCRLRWTNYLRPDIKRGKFSLQEEQSIIQLHALLGNRWSVIATHLPKRTDNEIKNYWNTHLKKRLTKMGIDPTTHKPKTNTLASGKPKDTAKLSHMAQWESARLEAEARLVRESKMMSSNTTKHQNKPGFLPPCLDILKVWQGTITARMMIASSNNLSPLSNGNLLSPTFPLNFSDNMLIIPNPSTTTPCFGQNDNASFQVTNYVGKWKPCEAIGMTKEEENVNVPDSDDLNCIKKPNDYDHEHERMGIGDNTIELDGIELGDPIDAAYEMEESVKHPGFMQGVLTEDGHDSINPSSPYHSSIIDVVVEGNGADLEDDRKYWNNILNDLATTFASGSPLL